MLRTLQAHLKQPAHYRVNSVLNFILGLFVGGLLDLGDDIVFLAAKKAIEQTLGLLLDNLHVAALIIRHNDIKILIHNIGFLGEDIDKVDVVIHQHVQEHIVLVAANVNQAVNIRPDVNAP